MATIRLMVTMFICRMLSAPMWSRSKKARSMILGFRTVRGVANCRGFSMMLGGAYAVAVCFAPGLRPSAPNRRARTMTDTLSLNSAAHGLKKKKSSSLLSQLDLAGYLKAYHCIWDE